jgi:competence protein ComEC
MLRPGDAEKQVAREMLFDNGAEALHSDVLKAGHHGSKNSTIPEFLGAARPRVGIISAGEANPYRHPHEELLERLENAGVLILRTDRDGAVHVLTESDRIEISCFVACPGATNAGASMQAQTPNHQQNQKQE